MTETKLDTWTGLPTDDSPVMDDPPPKPKKRNTDVSNSQSTKLPPVIWVILLVMAVLIGVLGWKLLEKPSGGGGKPEVVDVGSTPADAAAHFVSEYKRGMSLMWSENAKKAGNGDFSDFQDATESYKDTKDTIRSKAFEEMGKHLESINGENWDKDKAAKIYAGFSEGFKK